MRGEDETVTYTMGRKMPSQSSIASTLSSLYDEYNIHINILKWTGVVVLLALMSTSIALTSSTTRPSRNNSDCRSISTTKNAWVDDMNDTLCSYVKEYDLTEEYKVTVCLNDKKVTIAIREKKRNGEGIFMNKRDWNYLRNLMPYVTRAVKRAELVKRQKARKN